MIILIRHGLSGLSDATSDQLATLQAQYDAYTKQMSDTNNQILFANQQYNLNHFGGQSPDQFAAYMNQLNAQLADIQFKQNDVATKIQNLKNQQAQAAVTKTAAPPTAAQVAQGNQDAATAYREQLMLVTQPGYDYGVGSMRRNQFFGLSRLADEADRDQSRFMEENNGGLFYYGPGLALDIGGDILKGVMASLPQLSPYADSIAKDLGIPTALPAPLAAVGQNIMTATEQDAAAAQKAATAAAQNAAMRAQAKSATQTLGAGQRVYQSAGTAFAAVSSSPLLMLAVGVAIAVGVSAAMSRGRR